MKIINAKRVISSFLVFILFTALSLSTFAVPVAEADSSIDKNDEYQHMINLFEILGLIQDYDNFSDTKIITRGYFSMVAARLYNTPYDGVAQEPRFADVPLYSSYADSIEFLMSNGVINGDGTGFFCETDKIKTIDAVKMLVLIAGYGSYAELNGGYPDGYVKAGYFTGILDGAGNLYDYVTPNSMLVLISNFLNTNEINQEFKGSGATVNEKDDSKFLLETFFGVKEIEGVVTQNDLTAFFSASDLPENVVEITDDGRKYTFYSKTSGNLIGKKVKAFYREDMTEMGEMDAILYAYCSNDSANKTIDISDIQLSASTQGEIKYYTEEKNKSAKETGVATPTVIYNKVAYAEGEFNFADVLSDKSGTIELIDNNNDGKYDVLNISAYKSFMIGNVLVDRKKVYSRWDAYGINTNNIDGDDEVDVDPDAYDSFSMKYTNGNEADILELVDTQVMSYAISSPSAKKKAIDIVISSDVRSGKVNELEFDANVADRCYVTLDSREKLETKESVLTNFDIECGRTYTFCIDMFGNIVGTRAVSTGYFRYGVFLECYKANDDFIVKLFTAENSVQEMKLAEKVYIDGKKYKNVGISKELTTRINNVLTEQDRPFEDISDYDLKTGVFPIRYMLDDNGRLYKIDTAASDKNQSEDDGLILDKSGEFYAFYDSILFKQSTLEYVPYSQDTPVIWFSLDDYELSEYDETSIEISSASSLTQSFEKKVCVTYKIKNNTDSEYPYADMVMVFEDVGVSMDTSFMVVDKIKYVYDEKEDDYLPCLVGILQGAETEMVVSGNYVETFNSFNLKKGDTVRAATTGGYMIHLSLVSQYSESDGVEVATITDPYGVVPSKINATNQKRWCYVGYVAERRGELLKIKNVGSGNYALQPTEDEMSDPSGMVYAHPTASTTVTVFDRSENRVFSGSYDDILDYVHHKEQASRIILRYESAVLKEIVVYND